MAGGYSSDGPLEPIRGADPQRAIDAYHEQERQPVEPTHVRRLVGQVVSVHEKAGQHEESHILDESVGAQPHNDLIIRVPKGDLSHLVGRRVVIRVEAED